MTGIVVTVIVALILCNTLHYICTVLCFKDEIKGVFTDMEELAMKYQKAETSWELYCLEHSARW